MPVQRTEAADPHTTPQKHIFTLPSLSLETDKQSNTVKAITLLAYISIEIFIILGISICIWKKYRYNPSLMRVCFPLYSDSKCLWRTAYSNIFVQIVILHTTETLCAHFASVAIYPSRLRLGGYLNINYIQMLSSYKCFWYLISDWMGILLTDNMECVIKLPSQGHIFRQIMIWSILILQIHISYKFCTGFCIMLYLWHKTQIELLDYSIQ